VLRERRSPEERRDRRRFRHARLAVQLGVLALCVASIWQFHRFVTAVLAGSPDASVPARAPGFEAWTPIAALVSAVHGLGTAEFDPVHPAGLLILLGAVSAALVVRGSFCGWLCPVGTLFEALAALGRRLRLRLGAPPPRWIDLPLRTLPWLLLAFFGWGAVALGDYYYHVFDRYADVGMYGYWAWGRVGPVFLSVAGLSAAGGLIVDRFWCRYLCPYGALTQLFAKLSPWRVRRKEQACTDCGKCDRVCPALLPVSKLDAVTSLRCIGCGLCVAECPEKHALAAEMRAPALRRSLRPGWLATGLLALLAFAALPLLGQASGRWHSSIALDEYRAVIPRMRAGTLDRRHVMSRAEWPRDAGAAEPSGEARTAR
jgi:polyferredoxin